MSSFVGEIYLILLHIYLLISYWWIWYWFTIYLQVIFLGRNTFVWCGLRRVRCICYDMELIFATLLSLSQCIYVGQMHMRFPATVNFYHNEWSSFILLSNETFALCLSFSKCIIVSPISAGCFLDYALDFIFKRISQWSCFKSVTISTILSIYFQNIYF